MKLQRVAITGVGAICGLGHDSTTVWKNALLGVSGVTKLERPSPFERPVDFGGEVKNFKLDPDLMNEKDQERFDLFIHYALHAGNEALQMSGVLEAGYAKEKIGSILGTGLGGFPHIEMNYRNYMEKGSRRVSPFFIPSVIPNMAPGMLSMRFGFQGINYSIASACASAAHAVQAAATEIMLGRQDAIITGGTEAVITGYTISGFNSMKALSRRSDDPAKASRPFDKDRDGFVMGEGAGILILENMDKAIARGAKIIAEVVGFGATSDAHHFTSPHPEGAGAILCMKSTLEMCNVKPEEVGYVNAHGTSTPLGDIAETKSIKSVFGSHAYNMKVSSTKSMTGHLLGAAGGLESIFCALALRDGMIAPTINLDNPDAECDLNYVPNKAIKENLQFALNNSFGFGGTNSSTLFKKFN
jgi:3-oxoacyl-[acyl-carrier-protein] synthase II